MGKTFCNDTVNRHQTPAVTHFFISLLKGRGGRVSGFLTSTLRPGSRLSTGKSGRPRSDDSWEHNVVASDSSWDTLTRRIQQT